MNNVYKRSLLLSSQTEAHTKIEGEELISTKKYGIHYAPDLSAQVIEFAFDLAKADFISPSWTDDTGIDIYSSKVL